MCFANLLNALDIAAEAIQLCADNQLYIRIHLESLFQSHRIHIPGITLCINKNRNTAFINNRIQRSIKGHIAAENTLAL